MRLQPAGLDVDVVERMRVAHRRARTALGVRPAHQHHERWGWRGRTLSGPVVTANRPAWLRIACTDIHHAADTHVMTFWEGSAHAQTCLPGSIPRPRLHRIFDWSEGSWTYRAELYDRVPARPVFPSAVLTTDPELPCTWWTGLATALTDIAAVDTARHTLHQRYLDRTMPRFLGTPITTTAPSWTTAHGDLHWANLYAPTLQIIDWEGWGLAPNGYDAAVLHTYSLLAPRVAARIRNELAHLLDTDSGRHAELIAITELLHAATQGAHPELLPALHARAALLLGRAVPVPAT